jgi:sec-independent protein translocase protein TatC
MRLVTLMVVAFGVVFTIPVLLVFLQLIGVLTPRTLLRAWRYAVVGTVALAAVITPSGDPISLFSLSVPMVVLYFVAIGVGHLLTRGRDR